jgi:hypothetical protein
MHGPVREACPSLVRSKSNRAPSGPASGGREPGFLRGFGTLAGRPKAGFDLRPVESLVPFQLVYQVLDLRPVLADDAGRFLRRLRDQSAHGLVDLVRGLLADPPSRL